jgi:hypothetical protein
MTCPSKFGRRVASVWRTVNRIDAATAQLNEREAVQPRTRWHARQCRELRRDIAKLTARAARQAAKLVAA